MTMAQRLEKWRESKTFQSLAPVNTNTSPKILNQHILKSPTKDIKKTEGIRRQTISHLNRNFPEFGTSPNNINPRPKSNMNTTFGFDHNNHNKNVLISQILDFSDSTNNQTSLQSPLKLSRNVSTEIKISKSAESRISFSKQDNNHLMSPRKNEDENKENMNGFSNPLVSTDMYEKYCKLENDYKILQNIQQQTNNQLQIMISERNQAFDSLSMAKEEINALNFHLSLQEQQVVQLEYNISTNLINHDESNTTKTRKYKHEITKLKQEKTSYEERANTMVKQMTTQMSQLQDMAMVRIQVSSLFICEMYLTIHTLLVA